MEPVSFIALLLISAGVSLAAKSGKKRKGIVTTPNKPLLKSDYDGWVWPVLYHPDGRPPKISSGWGEDRVETEAQGAHKHIGVDILYRRPAKVTKARYKADHGSAYYHAPEGTLIVAAHDGKIWKTGSGKLGKNVIIDHGPLKFATFYQHLDTVLVKKGQHVKAGQIIGTMGYGNIGDIRHLHFEVWRGGREDAVNPEPLMKKWKMLREAIDE